MQREGKDSQSLQKKDEDRDQIAYRKLCREDVYPVGNQNINRMLKIILDMVYKAWKTICFMQM